MGYLKSPLRSETLACDENEGRLIDDSNYFWTYTSTEFPILQVTLMDDNIRRSMTFHLLSPKSRVQGNHTADIE